MDPLDERTGHALDLIWTELPGIEIDAAFRPAVR
jgi:hypothetical protein